MRRFIHQISASLLLSLGVPAAPPDQNPEQPVAETHAASLQQREALLRKTIAKTDAWPNSTWDNNLCTLAALKLNEKTDEANARLLERTKRYLEKHRSSGALVATTPEHPDGAPWTFFSINDYVRILCPFHAKSTHHPRRLKPETEVVMREALWLWPAKETKPVTLPESLTLPAINDQPIITEQKVVYDSSFLNTAFFNHRISVTVGPLRCVIDLQSK